MHVSDGSVGLDAYPRQPLYAYSQDSAFSILSLSQSPPLHPTLNLSPFAYLAATLSQQCRPLLEVGLCVMKKPLKNQVVTPTHEG